MVNATRAIVAVAVSRIEYVLSTAWVIGPVMLVALSLAAHVGSAAGQLSAQQEHYNLELQQRMTASVGPVPPSGRVVDRALRVIRPPSLAALLVPGEEQSLPAAWDIGPGSIESLPPYLASSQSGLPGGTSDGATFIGQFGGVLALALGLTSVLRDRRRGWQDVERSTICPPSAFIVAHLFSAALVLALVVSFWFFAADFAISRVEGHDWPDARVTLWLLAPVVWLYTLTLYSYGAAMGWFFRDPLRAVATAAILWLLLILLGPQAGAVWPVPSIELQPRARAEQERRDAYLDLVKEVETEIGNRIAPRFGAVASNTEKSELFEAMFQELEPLYQKGMADARALAHKHEQEWSQQAEHLANRRRRAAQLTPTTLLPQALAEVSGTGHLMRIRWERAVSDYKNRLNRILFDDRPYVTITLMVNGEGLSERRFRHPVIPTADLPKFETPAISLEDRWQAARGDVLALTLHAALALALAALAQRRAWRGYDFVSSSSSEIGKP